MDGFLEFMGFLACCTIVAGAIIGLVGMILCVCDNNSMLEELKKRVSKLEGRVQDTDGTD